MNETLSCGTTGFHNMVLLQEGEWLLENDDLENGDLILKYNILMRFHIELDSIPPNNFKELLRCAV